MTDHFANVVAKAIGAEIRRCRNEAGISQEALARRLGTHRPIVARVERGVHVPEIDLVCRYAHALGVHPIWDIISVIDDLAEEHVRGWKPKDSDPKRAHFAWRPRELAHARFHPHRS